MSGDEKLEKVNEGANSRLSEASSENFTVPNMASRTEGHPSDSTSSKCASADTASSRKESNQQPVVGQAHPAASLHLKVLNSVKTSDAVDTKVSQLSLNSLRLSTASHNCSRSTLQNQSLKPMNKVPQPAANTQSSGIVKGGGYPMKERSSSSNQGQRESSPNNNGPSIRGGYPYQIREIDSFSDQGQRVVLNNGPMSNKSNSRTWDGKDRFKFGEKFQRNGEFKPCSETNRGPRARGGQTLLSSPAKKDLFGLTLVRRDKYNLPNFETEYENAKFFVIKSFTEVDIHNSIKYDVWASTVNGNRKLDAAFRDAERISSETGKPCPIFLFFSANGSGQFVGLAEMTGPVDFKKDLDVWVKKKWCGFLPIEWHIIKDIPSYQLQHIILENNENKPVTHSRDTQEIGFKQGSEMLTIFKSYPAKTMLLDDFGFYENQEKSLPDSSSKSASPQIMTYGDEFFGRSFIVPDCVPVPPTVATPNSAFISDSRFATSFIVPDRAPVPPTVTTPNSTLISDSPVATSSIAPDRAPLPPTVATPNSALISNSCFATSSIVPDRAPVPSTVATPNSTLTSDSCIATSSIVLDRVPVPSTVATLNSALISDSPIATSSIDPDRAPVPPTVATPISALISDSCFATTGDDMHLRHAHSNDNYKSDVNQKCTSDDVRLRRTQSNVNYKSDVDQKCTSDDDADQKCTGDDVCLLSTQSNDNYKSDVDQKFTGDTDDDDADQKCTGDDVCLLRRTQSNDNYKSDADQKCELLAFNEGDMVMIYQRRRRDEPHKLQMRRIGPFPILKPVNDQAYMVDLPSDYGTNNTFNASSLTAYTGNTIPPGRLPMAARHQQPIASDRISVVVMKKMVTTRYSTYSMFLVELENKSSTWITEKSFWEMDPDFYNRYMSAIEYEEDRQAEENDGRTQTTNGHEPEGIPHGSGEPHGPIET